MTEFKYIIPTEDDGLEVREIIRNRFDFSSRLRSKIKRERLTLLNGRDTEGWHKVKEGDVVSITLPQERSHFPPEPIPLNIVYEDDYLMVIDKQPGLVVHPTKGHPAGTVANALSYLMEERDEPWKIRFVNRLDRDTSGLLIVAKNSYCQNHITDQMRKNLIRKKYLSILKGTVTGDEGTVDLPIGRPDPEDVRRGVMEGGSPSITHYKVREYLKGYTLVELVLETGRTHQIRVHMSHIGHPVLGDTLYGGEDPHLIDRQALHAAELHFIHPMTREPVVIEAPVPDDMNVALEKIRNL